MVDFVKIAVEYLYNVSYSLPMLFSWLFETDGSLFEAEGASGYSSGSDEDEYKGAAGGYGFSRGQSRITIFVLL